MKCSFKLSEKQEKLVKQEKQLTALNNRLVNLQVKADWLEITN